MSETNERVKFKRGKSTTIPTTKEAGTLLIETDTGNAYVDDTDTVRVQLKDSTKLSLSGGDMEGDINMGDNNIESSHAPTDPTDVVNKEYVDKELDDRIVEYSAEDPISIEDDVIKHASYSTQSGGPSEGGTLKYGDSFKVPSITSDSHGHVKDVNEVTFTLPVEQGSIEHANSADTAEEADKLATKRKIDGVEFDGTSDIIHYGVCETTGETQDKIVECEGFNLVVGAEIDIKFEYDNELPDIFINVNTTGLEEVYYNGSVLTEATAGYIKANHVYRFVYDGTGYVIVGDIDTAAEGQDYTAVSPIQISSDHVISHETFLNYSGGPTSDTTVKSGDTINIPYIQSDTHGHVSNIVDRSVTFEGGEGSDYTAEDPIEIQDDTIKHKEYGSNSGGQSSSERITTGTSFNVPYIESDKYGHVTGVSDSTMVFAGGDSASGDDAVDMILTNTARAFLLDDSGNAILSKDDTGIIIDWPICGCSDLPNIFTDEIKVENDLNDDSISLKVDDDGSRGLYDVTDDEWIVYKDEDSVIHLGSDTVGSGTTPIYLDAGVFKASTASVGDTSTPIYLDAGVFKACTSSGTGDYLPLTGGTLTGALTINSTLSISGTTTMSNYLRVTANNAYPIIATSSASEGTSAQIQVVSTWAERTISLQIGSGGENRGVYDNTTNMAGWIVYKDKDQAIHLGASTVGGTARPIYLSSGVPTALTGTIGSGTKPIYLSSGTLTVSSSTVGSSYRPVYLNGGTLTQVSAGNGFSRIRITGAGYNLGAGNNTNIDIDYTQENYTYMGVIGWRIYNYDTSAGSGQHASNCFVTSCYRYNSSEVRLNIRNSISSDSSGSDNQARFNIQLDILYYATA